MEQRMVGMQSLKDWRPTVPTERFDQPRGDRLRTRASAQDWEIFSDVLRQLIEDHGFTLVDPSPDGQYIP